MTIDDKIRESRIQEALDKLDEALENLESAVGEDSFAFVGSTIVYGEDRTVLTHLSLRWDIGDNYTCLTAAKCLVEEIERDQMLDYNLN